MASSAVGFVTADIERAMSTSSVILSDVDVNVFKKLGMNVTCEPVYQSHSLYHK